jgi:hypothetical protein
MGARRKLLPIERALRRLVPSLHDVVPDCWPELSFDIDTPNKRAVITAKFAVWLYSDEVAKDMQRRISPSFNARGYSCTRRKSHLVYRRVVDLRWLATDTEESAS